MQIVAVMRTILKQALAHVPAPWQHTLKQVYFRYQIRVGRFRTPEREFDLLPRLVRPGDYVLDVGANVGHYTRRLSELVGPRGRVIAFEPIPTTFAHLASNIQPYGNVTLFNAAASNKTCVAKMAIPRFLENGLVNTYEAHLVGDDGADHAQQANVYCVRIDSLAIPKSIRLAKIDAEGHEFHVLQGMLELIETCHPALIVEGINPDVIRLLTETGYSLQRLGASSNVLFQHRLDPRRETVEIELLN